MTTTTSSNANIALVGFGEAAQAFLSGWALERPDRVTAYDIKTDNDAQRPEIEARYRASGVSGTSSLAAALAEAGLIFSLVTADQALAAAEASAGLAPAGALWLDCNSCAPDTKRAAAQAIEASGMRYVDVAVMAPVYPGRHRVPLLVSGPAAEAAAVALEALGMRPRVVGGEIGRASSIKMIRSVMIKGMEALTAECVLAARRAGVEDEVLASLQASDPEIDWRAAGAYRLERMMVHGVRRAAEMREVAATVAALGLPAAMSAATAAWQDEVAATGAPPGEDDVVARADRILGAL